MQMDLQASGVDSTVSQVEKTDSSLRMIIGLAVAIQAVWVVLLLPMLPFSLMHDWMYEAVPPVRMIAVTGLSAMLLASWARESDRDAAIQLVLGVAVLGVAIEMLFLIDDVLGKRIPASDNLWRYVYDSHRLIVCPLAFVFLYRQIRHLRLETVPLVLMLWLAVDVVTFWFLGLAYTFPNGQFSEATAELLFETSLKRFTAWDSLLTAVAQVMLTLVVLRWVCHGSLKQDESVEPRPLWLGLAATLRDFLGGSLSYARTFWYIAGLLGSLLGFLAAQLIMGASTGFALALILLLLSFWVLVFYRLLCAPRGEQVAQVWRRLGLLVVFVPLVACVAKAVLLLSRW